MNDTLKLMMYGKVTDVPKDKIVEIKSGKALTTTGPWFDIICDVCTIDYESVEEAGYLVCNICNKVTMVEDLKP